jgi:hypothetical protein
MRQDTNQRVLLQFIFQHAGERLTPWQEDILIGYYHDWINDGHK